MSSIEWAEPPAPRYGPDRLAIFTTQVRDALRSRPGEWACVVRSHKSAASASLFSKRHPEYETTTRTNPDKTVDIYARFVGEQS